MTHPAPQHRGPPGATWRAARARGAARACRSAWAPRWLRPLLAGLSAAVLLSLASGACARGDEAMGDPAATTPGDSAATTGDAADGDPATVQFSKGETASGRLRFDQALTIHDGTTLRAIPSEQILAIELRPDSEAMVQGWRFVEPGQPRKENVGAPYPVRHLQAVITTTDGTRIQGHLTTTVAWLTTAEADGPTRIILPAKQEGTSGQVLADLEYPVRLTFTTHAHASAGRRLRIPGLAAGTPVVVILRGSLARDAATPAAQPDAVELATPVELPVFLACQSGAQITVAFPPPATPELTALVQGAVDQAQDFLDHRQLLGAWAEGDDRLYGLVLLYRQGATTGGPEHPWRLEIWRWKREEAHLLWAGRNYFFRGVAANVGGLPQVLIHSAWWTQTMAGDLMTVGGQEHGR